MSADSDSTAQPGLLDKVDLEEFYAYPPDRQWVRSDFVASLDGAAWSRAGTSGSFGGEVDKAAFTTMRSLAEVIVVGAGTARTEKYKPVPSPQTLVVVSRSLDIPDTLIEASSVVVTSHAAQPERLRHLQQRTDVIVAGEHEIDWAAVMQEFTKRGWNRVLCEGGPTLHGDLLAAGVIDEICLTIAPVVASGDAGRIATHAVPLDQLAVLDGVLQVDGVLLTRWQPQRA